MRLLIVLLMSIVCGLWSAAGAGAQTWTFESPPTVPGEPIVGLGSITCAATNECFALGAYGSDQTALNSYLSRWDGQSWTRMTPPIPETQGGLAGLTCLTRSLCMGTGFTGTYPPLFAHWFGAVWNGSTWTVTAMPSASSNDHLGAPSCWSATGCMVIGHSEGPDGSFATLAERWNGANWTVVPTPHEGWDLMADVSCRASGWCVAVGQGQRNGRQTALLFTWDGHAWTETQAPNPYGTGELDAVTCPSATECIAVGNGYASSQPSQPLADRWDGHRWVSMPQPAVTGGGSLVAIACPQPSACMAVGATPGDAAMFGERWNGATWSVEPLPPGPDQTSLLSSAACPAVNLCYAVGYSDTLSDNTVATPLLVRADDITTLKTDQPAPKRRRRKSGARTSGHGVPYRP